MTDERIDKIAEDVTKLSRKLLEPHFNSTSGHEIQFSIEIAAKLVIAEMASVRLADTLIRISNRF